MLLKSRAIVLHTIRYTDDTFISNVLTERCGVVGFIVRRSKSKKTAVKHTLFQPLTHLCLEWNQQSKALARPKSAQVDYVYSSLPYDSAKMGTALFLTEFLSYVLRTEPPSAELFEYIESSLRWYDEAREGYANFHLTFLMRLLRLLGFRPNLENYTEGDCFDLEAGSFCASQPLHGNFVPVEHARLMPQLMRMNYHNMHLFKFSGSERQQLLHVINKYYSLHVPNFPTLRSIDVLHEVYAHNKQEKHTNAHQK